MLIIQQIELKWYKSDRNSKAATIRNSIAHAFKLPNNKIYDGEILFHAIDFVQHINKIERYDNLKFYDNINNLNRKMGLYPCIAVHNCDEIYQINFKYNPNCGIPFGYGEKTVLTLNSNEYGRIIFNRRFTNEDGWFYTHYIINIFNIATFATNLFTSNSPFKEYRQLVKLYYNKER